MIKTHSRKEMPLQIHNDATSIFILVTTLETSKIGNFYSYHKIDICIDMHQKKKIKKYDGKR